MTIKGAKAEFVIPDDPKIEYRDDEVPGLILKPNQTKPGTWYLEYRNADGRKRRGKIGPGSMTLDRARSVALSLLSEMSSRPDFDFVAERRERRRARRLAKTKPRSNPTVDQVFNEWVKVNHRKKSLAQDIKVWRRYEQGVGAVYLTSDNLSWLFEALFEAISMKGEIAANRWLSVARSVFRYAMREGYIKRSPVRNLKMHVERHRERVVSMDEMRRINTAGFQLMQELEGAGRKARADVVRRARIAIWFLYYTGARCGEVLDKPIPFEGIEHFGIWNVTGKSGERRLYVGAKAANRIATLREIGKTEEVRFPTHRQVQYVFDRLCEIADVRNARLHDLRHSFATGLRSKGVPYDKIAQLLGHKSVHTSERYVNMTDGEARRLLHKVEF